MNEQMLRFIELVRRNPVNRAILARLPALDIANGYLVAGCLVQSVWNALSRRPPAHGIDDYDIFYFDDRDTSWQAEDAVIRRGRALFADLDADIQIRNQARVHRWYEAKFGIACQPLTSCEDGIDHFLNQSSCVALRPVRGGYEVYAPFGFDDLFAMVVRPNPGRDLPQVYHDKARRWSSLWPALTVLPWPEAATRRQDAPRVPPVRVSAPAESPR